MYCLAAENLGSIPDISEAIGAGCMVSMAIVCLIQYGLYIYQTVVNRRRAFVYQSEIRALSQDLDGVQKDRSMVREENRLLREFLSTSDHEKAADLLLNYFAPNPANEFAALLSFEDSVLALKHSRGLSETSCRDLSLSFGELESLAENQVVVLKDRELFQSGFWKQLDPVDQRKASEIIVFPIVAGAEMCGAFLTTTLQPQAASRDEQIPLSQRLLASISASLQQSRSMKDREKQIRITGEMLQLRALTDRNYSTPLDMVQTYLSVLKSMLESDGTTIFLPTHENQVDWKPMARCEPGLIPTLQKQWEAHEKRLLEIFDPAAEFQNFDEAALKDLGIETLMRSAFLVPLVQNQQVTGVFCFARQRHGAFAAAERQLGIWAAQHLGKSLLRLQSIADIQRQAKQDGLTELANRRTFDEQLEREIRVAQRAGVECSLLLCDLDRFKTVNDTYGHQAGDEVLRVVARILQEKSLKTRAGERALTARYGGEELAIILPGQPKEVALRVAKEILAAVSEETVWWRKIPINVTISIGVGTFPNHAATAEALITVTDEALFLAKSRGRNRACAASAPENLYQKQHEVLSNQPG